ncbi:MAG TPA: GNAT family N-acetyltransferase [Saprospiraceae bacterium]|nr:GNAT family N-acetyltransferase [Saprospiraceae bacterium]HMP15277.1 GNAT family N-acetyltransferase [Saprospiraceae bacterium]
MNPIRIEEFQIDAPTRVAIQQLLQQCFDGYPARTFFKQAPAFRYLVWQQQQLVAHLAVEHRMINNDGLLVRIFGISDLCVAPAFQHQRIASRLLEALEQLGRAHQIDFLMLQATDPAFYLRHQFANYDNTCKWLLIQGNQTLGVVHRRLSQSLMVKPLGTTPWKNGPVDFLGHVF